MKTMLFNPYTGLPRHPSDIQSDPQGLAMVDPDEPLRPAKKLEAADRIEHLERVLVQARKALQVHGKHDRECAAKNERFMCACDCGLDKSIAAIDEALGEKT
jgi:hypothetical protein